MKRKLKLFGVGLLSPFLLVVPVSAIAYYNDSTPATNNNSGPQVLQAQAENDDETTRKAELKTRLEERKASLKIRLDAAKQVRIRSRCKASQGNLSNVSGRIKGLETSRTEVYENLLSRLTRLSEKLQTHDVDTAELDGQITELTTMIETFKTNLESYKQAVSDLAEMDCVADPTAFQASLEVARTERAETAESAKAIRTFLSEIVKPTLKELRQQFADNASDSGNENTETEGEETE